MTDKKEYNDAVINLSEPNQAIKIKDYGSFNVPTVEGPVLPPVLPVGDGGTGTPSGMPAQMTGTPDAVLQPEVIEVVPEPEQPTSFIKPADAIGPSQIFATAADNAGAGFASRDISKPTVVNFASQDKFIDENYIAPAKKPVIQTDGGGMSIIINNLIAQNNKGCCDECKEGKPCTDGTGTGNGAGTTGGMNGTGATGAGTTGGMNGTGATGVGTDTACKPCAEPAKCKEGELVTFDYFITFSDSFKFGGTLCNAVGLMLTYGDKAGNWFNGSYLTSRHADFKAFIDGYRELLMNWLNTSRANGKEFISVQQTGARQARISGAWSVNRFPEWAGNKVTLFVLDGNEATKGTCTPYVNQANLVTLQQLNGGTVVCAESVFQPLTAEYVPPTPSPEPVQQFGNPKPATGSPVSEPDYVKQFKESGKLAGQVWFPAVTDAPERQRPVGNMPNIIADVTPQNIDTYTKAYEEFFKTDNPKTPLAFRSFMNKKGLKTRASYFWRGRSDWSGFSDADYALDKMYFTPIKQLYTK